MTNSNMVEIDQFKPNPKRFMVWNKKRCEFCQNTNNHKGIFSLTELQPFVAHHPDFEFVQSTNIFDKDGKEIFEGGIVESSEGIKFLVRQDHYCGKWLLKNIKTGDCGNSLDGWDNGRDTSIAVIGHILSNPELLGRGNNRND